MNATLVSEHELREVLLAELRCGSMRARLAQHAFDAVGIAPKLGLVSAAQAMEILHARDVLPWLLQDQASAA